jgi:hypothetical protein
LRECPSKDKSNDLRAPFWPIGGENSVSPGALEIEPNLENSMPIQASSAALNSPDSAILNVLQSLPAVMVTSYFGPGSQMPKGHRICGTGRPGVRQTRQQGGQGSRQEAGQNRIQVEQGTQQREAPVSTLNRVLNAIDVGASSTFNPHMDVQTDMFVAMETCDDDRAKGIPFFVAKVINMNRQACSDGTVLVLWYQPKMPIGLQDDVGKFNKRYMNCIERGWELSRENHDFVPIQSIFTAWKNTVGIKNLCLVQCVRTEKDLKIPDEQKYHLYHHLELINWQYVDSSDTEMKSA